MGKGITDITRPGAVYKWSSVIDDVFTVSVPNWLGSLGKSLEQVSGVVSVTADGWHKLTSGDVKLGADAKGLSQAFGIVTDLANGFGRLPEKVQASMGKAVTAYQTTIGGARVVGHTLEQVAALTSKMKFIPDGAKDSINQVVGVYQGVVGRINQVDATLKNLAGQWSLVKDGAGTFAKGLAKLGLISDASALKTMAFSAAQKAWAIGSTLVVTAARAVTGGIRMMSLAILSNPIGLVIGGVALAAGLLIAKWDKVGPFFQKLWGGIVDIFKKGIALLKKVLEFSPLGMLFKGIKALGGLFGGEAAAEEPAQQEKAPAKKGAHPFKKAAAATAVGAALAVAPAAAEPPPAVSSPSEVAWTAPAAGSPAALVTVHAPITIYAAPGMDEQAVAGQVRLALEQAMDRAQASRRGALHD